MMLDEERVAGMLRDDVAATERDSTVLDLGRAMATGRRHRWYRRVAGAAAVAVAVTAGAAAVPGIMSTMDADRTPPDSRDTGAAAGGIGTAPEAFDPLIHYVRFGWLPDGLSGRQYQAGMDYSGSVVTAIADADTGTGTGTAIVVRLLPRGGRLDPPQVDTGERAPEGISTPAPDVHGRAASWVTFAGRPGDVFLRWQYATDGWIELRVRGNAGGSDPKVTAHRVAEDLRLSGTEPVRLPGTVKDLPPGVRLIQTDVVRSAETGQWTARLTFTTAPAGAGRIAEQTNTVELTIGSDLRPSDKGAPPAPNTTLDGYRAYRLDTTFLAVYGVEGSVVVMCVADPAAAAAQLGPEGCVDLFRRTKVTAGWQPRL